MTALSDCEVRHGHRPEEWGPPDFFNEFGSMTQAYSSDSQVPVKNNLIAPSVSSSGWTPEQVWDTGFVEAYSDYLQALAVEQYVVIAEPSATLTDMHSPATRATTVRSSSLTLTTRPRIRSSSSLST